MRPLASIPVRLAAIAAAVVLCAGAPAAQQVFRSGVDLVRLPVVVSARDGTFLRGLSREDFEVYEDGRRQTVRFFAEGANPDVPLHAGLLLDVSESMADDLDRSANAAVRFVEALEEARDVTLVDFDDEVRLAEFRPGQYLRLFERIRNKEAQGATALFDAIGMYLQRAAAQEGQKVLLIYTDGVDSTSRLSFGKLLTMLREHDVLVYPIGYLSRESRMAQPQMQLSEIARYSGGESYFPNDPRELSEIYARILDEVMSRYTLGYLSTNPEPDGKWRKIEVKVSKDRAPKAKVRTRLGYFAK